MTKKDIFEGLTEEQIREEWGIYDDDEGIVSEVDYDQEEEE